MIATPQPKQIGPSLLWEGRHLYQVWPSGRRRYAGSIVRETFHRSWSAWRRGEFIARYSDEAGAREGLEERAREDR
jgi:hypothetical protein